MSLNSAPDGDSAYSSPTASAAPRSAPVGTVPRIVPIAPPRQPVLVIQPTSLADVLAAEPSATLVAGGTAVLVEMNAGRAPARLVDLSRVRELAAVEDGGDVVRIGATVTYTRIIEGLGDRLPGLAMACRTIASRQIRNRGTLGGALALRDPASDALAALLAADARVEIVSASGARTVAAGEVRLRPGEVLTAILVPVADGPVAYAKAGMRNAMARAICGVAVALHPARRRVAIGVVGARAGRARAAEELLEERWRDARPDGELLRRAGELAGAAVAPVPAHMTSVLTRRALERAWS
jgi:CO/xanthine dehydrogenase FAD-binding subunit